jgi:hypothetical protein
MNELIVRRWPRAAKIMIGAWKDGERMEVSYA